MVEIRIYPDICKPWNTFNMMVASNITGNQLRTLLHRKINGDGVLNVSYFRPYCECFFREFIQPCLDDKGYAQNGVYTTHSYNLDMDVTYRVEVVAYSRAVRDANDKFKPLFMKYDGVGTVKEIVTKLIKYL